MPKYNEYENKHFEIKKLRKRVDDLQADNPEVEKIFLDLVGNNPETITLKPRKKAVVSQERVINGEKQEMETEKKVKFAVGDLPENIEEISDALRDQAVVELKGTVTKGTFEKDDGGERTHFWINNVEDLQLVEPRGNEKDNQKVTDEEETEEEQEQEAVF